MAKLVHVLSPLALVALTMCSEAPAARQEITSPAAAARLQNAPAVQLYRVHFDELNNSGVNADATLEMQGGNLTVVLDAVGRVPDHVHPQHIHGFTSAASTCPTAANDVNGDGTITFAEGFTSFGPVQVDLMPYPTPANSGGATHYRRTFVAAQVPFTAAELTQKTMVLHGDFFGGAYNAGLPVACGAVQAVNALSMSE